MAHKLLHGHSVTSTTFQETFLRPTAPTASPSVRPTTSTTPNREQQQQLGGHADLAVNQHWLDIFRIAKQKYLEEQDHLHLSSTNHLYDNHRARAQKKWWNEKPTKKNRNKKTEHPATPSSPPTPASTAEQTAKDTEREELEASLSAQFDEELARTSARFYPALPVRTPSNTGSEEDPPSPSSASTAAAPSIDTNTGTTKDSKKSKRRKRPTKTTSTTTSTTTSNTTSNKPHSNKGGAFQSSELSKRYEAISWGNVFDGTTTADCLFVRSALIRKDLLHTFDEPANIVPRTFVVHSRQDVIDAVRKGQRETWLQHKNNKNNKNKDDSNNNNNNNNCSDVWVIKPPDSSNAFGISFFQASNVEQQSMSLYPSSATTTPYVLQRYVRPCLTTNRRKFHLRQMILCVGGAMNSVDLWVYNDVRVLVATHGWQDNAWDDVYCHITNGSVNRHAPDYNHAMQNVGFEAVFPAQKTNEKRTTEEVMGGKGEEKGTYQKEENGETFRSTRSDADTTRRVAGDALRNQMKVDLIQLIKAVHVNAKKSTFMTLPGTYELFGVDWAVDQRGKGWVLEINPEPSMLLYPQLKRGREEMLGGDFFDKKNGDGLPSGWEKIWSSQMMDAMKRLRRKR